MLLKPVGTAPTAPCLDVGQSFVLIVAKNRLVLDRIKGGLHRANGFGFLIRELQFEDAVIGVGRKRGQRKIKKKPSFHDGFLSVILF